MLKRDIEKKAFVGKVNGKIYINPSKLSLDEWIKVTLENIDEFQFIDCRFPTEKHLNQYLRNIDKRKHSEIKMLLRKFLIHSNSLGCDETMLSYLDHQMHNDKKAFDKSLRYEHIKRLFLWSHNKEKGVPPWEGITWIIDLLPNHPNAALETLHSYFLAHCMWMPDGRIEGLFDACAIIRAKYIGLPTNQTSKIDILKNLSPRDFEHLIERTFNASGYQTKLTKAKCDGGKDVIAVKRDLGKNERILIECKLYKDKIGVNYIRAILGVVSDEKANKGILITSGTFTKGAINFAKNNPRIELINGGQAIVLMNQYLGTEWPIRIERIIADSMRENKRLIIEKKFKKDK